MTFCPPSRTFQPDKTYSKILTNEAAWLSSDRLFESYTYLLYQTPYKQLSNFSVQVVTSTEDRFETFAHLVRDPVPLSAGG